jgi:FKBP-type peptidyl-prolyl cis-trans isomerase
MRIGQSRWCLLVIALSAALLLSGCKAKEQPKAETAAKPVATAEAPSAPAPAEAPKAAASSLGQEDPNVEAARKLGTPSENPVVAAASGLKYIDVKAGEGTEAVAGKNVSVHYTGWLVNGTKFDSSVDRGTPFQFPVGAGRVIRGWDEGVAGMKVGGVRKLIIPSDLGYGARGAGNVIPPNATLIFEVQLLGVQ